MKDLSNITVHGKTYLIEEELEELGVPLEIGAEFETDRISFITHRYVIIRREDPYWIAKCIA